VQHVNPTCGDEITLRVALHDAVVQDISYAAMGCSISQASTSVMYELLNGKPLGEVWPIHEAFVKMIEGRGKVEPDEDVLGDGIAFAGVASYPARVKCALLGWMAFKDATVQALGKDYT
jgi:nitrogen fixation NifU-like protein